jgi:Tol biopolymer transport system component
MGPSPEDPKIEPVDTFAPELIASELEQLCASPIFLQSERLKRFLRYAVEMTRHGDTERLKESVIGTEVFDRPLGYNPKTDAIVRVEAHRLRQKLDLYYASSGQEARLRFTLPKGKYSILFEEIAPPQPPVPPDPVDSGSGGTDSGSTPTRPSTAGWKALAALALVAGLAAGGWYTSVHLPEPKLSTNWRRLTLDSGFATDPVLMPDGKSVVYSADRGSGVAMSLWRQTLEGGEPVRLTPEPFDALKPDLSPDGRWIVYHSRDPRAPGIYRRPVSGGEPQLLVPAGQRPRYSPDGRWILYTLRNEQEWQAGSIGIVAAEGGAPVEIATDFADAHFGIFSEDSRWILFCGTRVSNNPELEHDWWIVEVPQNHHRETVIVKTLAFPNLRRHLTPGEEKVPPNEFAEQPAEWIGNFVYFSSPLSNPRSSTVPLWRLPLDKTMRYSGETAPERLSFGTSADLRARVRRVGKPSGHRAVVASGTTSIDIWKLPLADDGQGRLVGGPPSRATSHTDAELFPAASPDGRWLAFIGDRQAPRQLYLRDLASQAERRVHPSAFGQDFPVISPDSRSIAFRQYEQPAVPIFIAETGSSKVERVCNDCGAPTSWSPDGNHLLYEPGSTIAFVGRFNLRNRQPEVLLRHPEHSLRGARYSPNGRWIAFYAETSREGRRIFIAPADRETPPGEWIAVTSGGDVAMLPAWSADSTQLFYLSDSGGQRTIAGQRLHPQTARPVGPAFDVQRFNSPRRSLLRLTRTRVAAVGLSIASNQLYFALDEQLAEIFWADLPGR